MKQSRSTSLNGAVVDIVDPLCYLATPYTRYKSGLHAAFEDAAKIAAGLLLSDVKIYSPIVHGHPLAMLGNLDPKDHRIWLPFNEKMLALSDVLIVAHLDGWQESVGTAHEIKSFQDTDRPIFDLNPRTLGMTKRHGRLERVPLPVDDLPSFRVSGNTK